MNPWNFTVNRNRRSSSSIHRRRPESSQNEHHQCTTPSTMEAKSPPQPQPQSQPAPSQASSSVVHEPPPYLLFVPTGPRFYLRERFPEVPRYLLRAISPASMGEHSGGWVRSFDARRRAAGHDADLFARADGDAAAMLATHLRWQAGATNLVSWTSSPLLALQSLLYLHGAGHDAADVRLLAVDTAALPAGVFLRDADLLEAFHQPGSALDALARRRRRKHKDLAGRYYFGEYLSQGALRVDAPRHSQTVTLAALLERGVVGALRPEMLADADGNKRIASRVIELREEFYESNSNSSSGGGGGGGLSSSSPPPPPPPPHMVSDEEACAVVALAELFEPCWRLPMAAMFLALRPRSVDEDEGLKGLFADAARETTMAMVQQQQQQQQQQGGKSSSSQSQLASPVQRRIPGVTDVERRSCAAVETKIVPYDELPEVVQFEIIMRSIYHEYVVSRMTEFIAFAEKPLSQHMATLKRTVSSIERCAAKDVQVESTDNSSSISTPFLESRHAVYREQLKTLGLLTFHLEDCIAKPWNSNGSTHIG